MEIRIKNDEHLNEGILKKGKRVNDTKRRKRNGLDQ